MDQLNIATPGMVKAAGEFEAATRTATAQLSAIDAEMATLQTFWHGQASFGYVTAMERWEAEFKVIIDQLIHMMEVMGVNTKVYHEAENAAIGHSGSWLGGLEGI